MKTRLSLLTILIATVGFMLAATSCAQIDTLAARYQAQTGLTIGDSLEGAGKLLNTYQDTRATRRDLTSAKTAIDVRP